MGGNGNLMKQSTDFEYLHNGCIQLYERKCRIGLRKAHFHPINRNSPENIERRPNWVKRWMQTDMDFLSDCVCVFSVRLLSYQYEKSGRRWLPQGSRCAKDESKYYEHSWSKFFIWCYQCARFISKSI